MRDALKVFAKIVAGLAIAVCLIGIYFSNNIRGYYRFKDVCEREAGLRVFSKLKSDVGWWTDEDSISGAISAAVSSRIDFVRYKDSGDGVTYDVRYRGGNREDRKSYERTPADMSKDVRYRWKFVNESVPGELRLGRSGYEIFDLHTGQLAARFYFFGYSKFDQDHTLLSAPSGESCGARILWTPQNESQLFQ